MSNEGAEMNTEDIIKEVKKLIKTIIPPSIEITNIELEGPDIAIYTKNIEEFADNNDIVRQLAQGLRRRVAIRPDPSLLIDTEHADSEIRQIIPEEAEITDIYFSPESGEVSIEALSPGLAIGKHGSTLNEIKKRIGWAPKVVRSPPIPSKTIREIRGYLRTVIEERRDFLRKIGRKIYKDISDEDNLV